jgi:type I restriction-modification system DNA methylase subunit
MAESSNTGKSTKTRTSRRKANAPEPKLETMLWAAADKLRGHMDAAEYKHVVLGLIFLKDQKPLTVSIAIYTKT